MMESLQDDEVAQKVNYQPNCKEAQRKFCDLWNDSFPTLFCWIHSKINISDSTCMRTTNLTKWCASNMHRWSSQYQMHQSLKKKKKSDRMLSCAVSFFKWSLFCSTKLSKLLTWTPARTTQEYQWPGTFIKTVWQNPVLYISVVSTLNNNMNKFLLIYYWQWIMCMSELFRQINLIAECCKPNFLRDWGFNQQENGACLKLISSCNLFLRCLDSLHQLYTEKLMLDREAPRCSRPGKHVMNQSRDNCAMTTSFHLVSGRFCGDLMRIPYRSCKDLVDIL